jgi:lipopolysaccharide/colanic/teichoic acid biosynthesis glycosyltransferase
MDTMVRRIIDILLGSVLGILSIPFCFIIASAIKIEDGKNIFYSSPRIGIGGRKFNMLKFRTMSADRSLPNEQFEEFKQNFKLNYDSRITKTGCWLRQYSLDEIPQFLNVLKGDMSIIGPRPKLPEEIDLFKNDKNELLSILPGITGYWQVFRKTADSDENMRNMDLFYIRNRNFALDSKIFFLTFFTILSKRNY